MRKKYLISGLMLLFVFGLFFTPSLQVKATEKVNSLETSKMKKTINENVFYDAKEEKYFDTREDGYIDEVYELVDGEVTRKVPIEEYLNEDYEEDFSSSKPVKNGINLVSPLAVTVSYLYSETSNVETRIFGKRASIVQENPGPGTDAFTLGYSSSYSHNFNVSLKSGAIKAIETSVGYQYTRSSSISSSHKMDIPARYSGYWRFDPRVRKTQGISKELMHGMTMSKKTVRGYYPVKKNGGLDGWLVAVKNPL